MNLPEFEIEELNVEATDGSSSMLIVRCPRRDCGEEFWVSLKWRVLRLVNLTVIWGRPCPFCSRAAAIPEAWAVQPKKPRIVRRRRKS